MGLFKRFKAWLDRKLNDVEEKAVDYRLKKVVEDADSLLVKRLAKSFAITHVRKEDFSDFASYLYEIHAPHGILEDMEDEGVIKMVLINISYDDMSHIRKKFRLDGFTFNRPNYDGAHFVTWTYHRGDKKPAMLKEFVNIDRTFLETIGFLFDGRLPVHLKMVAHELNGRHDMTDEQLDGLLIASVSDVYTCEQRKKYREKLYKEERTIQTNGEEQQDGNGEVL